MSENHDPYKPHDINTTQSSVEEDREQATPAHKAHQMAKKEHIIKAFDGTIELDTSTLSQMLSDDRTPALSSKDLGSRPAQKSAILSNPRAQTQHDGSLSIKGGAQFDYQQPVLGTGFSPTDEFVIKGELESVIAEHATIIPPKVNTHSSETTKRQPRRNPHYDPTAIISHQMHPSLHKTHGHKAQAISSLKPQHKSVMLRGLIVLLFLMLIGAVLLLVWLMVQ